MIAKMNYQQMQSKVEQPAKIDPITAVQDSIDTLSLSLFEALRGLRDAVAPTIDHEDMEYEDFLMAYAKDQPYALELIEASDGNPPKSRDEYLKLRAKNEMKKHAELVPKLAQGVLGASDKLDTLVSELPGMHRTKAEQMDRIQELLDENKVVDEELQEVYKKTEIRRDEIRLALQKVTCRALGIEEEI